MRDRLYRRASGGKLSGIPYPDPMPYVAITVSHELFETVREKLLREASAAAAQGLGKPESSVQVALTTAHALFGGIPGPCAFVEVRSVGHLDANTMARLAQSLCEVLRTEADVQPERVYVHFMDVPRHEWAWNGALLG